jgi:integrase
MKGSVIKRVGATGATYAAMWRDATGKQHKQCFKRRKEADAFLVTTVGSVHRGTYQDVKPILFGDLLDKWLADSLGVRVKQGALKPSTEKSYRSMVAKHLRPAFGAVRTDRVTHAAVDKWVATLSSGIAAGTMAKKTYNNLMNLLRSILGWARHPARLYLGHDPLMGQKNLPREKQEREFLQPAEVATLLKAAGPPEDMIVHLAVYSGLRRGEIFGLRWGDIDFGSGKAGGRIHVRRAIYQGVVSSPKTEHSTRTVDVMQPTLTMLSIYRLEYPDVGPGYVFRTAAGSPMDPDNWYHRRFLPLLVAAGLRHIGIHALRHTYASLLINQGESIKYVSSQLGHASIQLTADLYGHLFRETGAAAMKRMARRMAKEGDANQRSNEGIRGNKKVTNGAETSRKEK